MNRTLFPAIALGIAFSVSANVATAPGDKPRLSTIERKAKLEAVVNQRVGGFLEKPGTAKGSIVYVNCQKKAPKPWIDDGFPKISQK